jgi:prephenate dehydrogenase
MEDGFRLQDAHIAIVGLGLMGGSLALALKGKCAALYGIDSNPATLKRALEEKIVEQADGDPAKLLPQTDLVVLATPIPTIVGWVQKLPSVVQKSCIVLDLGSTKREIVAAMSTLPEYFDPIGGHPICGKEKLGLENADAGIYREAPFVITALERTSSRARDAVEQIIAVIGARLIELTAEDHDRVLSFTSHSPFLISSALALATPVEFASLIGTGFRSTSRLAGTPSHMTMGFLESNRDNILHALQAFRDTLQQIESALSDENYSQLEYTLNRSRSNYQSLITNYQ